MGSDARSEREEQPFAPTRSGDALLHVAATLTRGLYSLVLSKEWRGAERLRREGGYIVVANHMTEMDPLTIGYPVYAHGTMPRFLAKDSLFRAPGLGWLLRQISQIPVPRGSMDARKSLAAARAAVEAGSAVIIYPEGTLTRDPDLWPMTGRTGAARLALETGAPVIPVAHWGDQELLPPKATRPRPFPRKRAKVLVGEPIDFSDLLDPEEGGHVSRRVLEQVTERMMGEITSLLEQLRGERAPAGRWDPRVGARVETGGGPSAPSS